MEIGALTVMTIGFREREMVLDLFELITGLRMNHAFIRPGGVAQDLPPGALDQIRDFVALMKKRLPEYADALQREPDLQGPARATSATSTWPAAWRSGITGPLLRSTGYAWDLRKTQPYCGYEDLRLRGPDLGHLRRLRPVPDPARRDVGVAARSSSSASTGWSGLEGAPVMVADKKIAWPSQLAVGTDGMGNSPRPHPAHHGRVDGGPDPPLQAGHRGLPGAAGQAYVPIESPARRARRARRLRRRHPARSGRTSATRRSPTCRRCR